jgi:PadR family transcriptional regulator, regulatory protein PadR
MDDSTGLLPGTLDLLILKAVSLGTLHGYGVLLRIQQITGGGLQVQQGALYPALYRLERQGLIDSEWGTSDNNRRAKFYNLTRKGRARLGNEAASWNRISDAITMALRATPKEIWGRSALGLDNSTRKN